MRKTAYQSKSSSSKLGSTPAKSEKFVDRNLAGMQPETAQEALKPTDSEPVNMHKRMAGAC